MIISRLYLIFCLLHFISPTLLAQRDSILTPSHNSAANNYHELGTNSMLNENYIQALEYLKKSLKLTLDKEAPELIYVHLKISDCYLYLDMQDDALNQASIALTLSKKHKNNTAICKSLYSIANVKLSFDDYTEAKKYYLEALALTHKKKELLTTKGAIYHNLGLLYSHLKQYELERKYFDLSLKIAVAQNNKTDIIITTNNIAMGFIERGEYQKAIAPLKGLLQIAQDTITSSQVILTHVHLANIFIENGEFTQALSYAKKGSKMSLKHTNRFYIEDFYKQFSIIYEQQGKLKEALEFHRLYAKAMDSLNNAHTVSRIDELKTIYQLEKKEKTIALLENKNELKQKEIDFSKKVILFILTLLTLLILFLSILYLYQRRQKASNQALVRLNLTATTHEATHNLTPTHEQNTEDLSIASDTMKLSSVQRKLLLSKIIESFENDKVYLRDDLTIVKLAEILNSNKSYLSKIINDHYNKNFSTFVNEYRIKEARELLADPSNWNLKIESIGYKVGFKSKSSFNKAFKLYTGITPSYFLASIQSKQ